MAFKQITVHRMRRLLAVIPTEPFWLLRSVWFPANHSRLEGSGSRLLWAAECAVILEARAGKEASRHLLPYTELKADVSPPV